MSEDAKAAKAAAKAAKAHAKALRPFYKQKRWWFGGAIALMVIITITSGSSNKQDESSPTAGPSSQDSSRPSSDVNQGIGSQDAADDVTNLDCGSEDALGFRYPRVTVTNNSSKASDYLITIVAESADGATRYDEAMLIISTLDPGQSTSKDGLPFTEELPDGATCSVSKVQRTAAL